MRTIDVDASAVTFLPVVKGLVSEAEAVSKAFSEVRPEVIAVSISREELEGLHNREDYDRYEPSDLEIIYQAFLERFGDVRIPPPAFVRAMELAEHEGITIVPLDMNEEMYTATYCDKVSTTDMIRESYFARRAASKDYDLSSASAFAISWDQRVNRSGFRELEVARERHMAGVLRNLSRRYRTILAVVECERSEGVLARLGAEAGAEP